MIEQKLGLAVLLGNGIIDRNSNRTERYPIVRNSIAEGHIVCRVKDEEAENNHECEFERPKHDLSLRGPP